MGTDGLFKYYFSLTYNKPLDISNQGFMMIHSATVHIKDKKTQVTNNLNKKQSETAYGVGGRET